ncbi:MAG: ATP-binding protein [Desulfobacteraceae bacterium]|nr:MAG: ATP-binding protein [Desulfobacteraceae bacterium]
MKSRQDGISIASSPDQAKKADPDASLKNSLHKIKHIFMIMSGKGGVGKSSTSVNLAIALAGKGFQVGLMDVDIHGPDIPRMLGLSAMLDLDSEQKLVPAAFSENLKVMSVESLSINKDDAIIWRGPMKYSAIRQFIADVAWGDLDFLLIDAPPGTGDEPLTIAQIIPHAKAIIVTTPQEISLADVRKSISFCKTVKMEIFGLVENMSGFVCPHCNEALDMFGSGGGEKTAQEAGIAFLGKIPFDTKMVSCGDQGVSFQEKHADSAVGKAFLNIAERMASLVSGR